MIYFITETFLKTYTAFNNNIDMSKVEHIIKTSFDLNIEEMLGTYFSSYLLAKHQLVIANQATYTPYEEKLVDYIQLTIAWGATYDSVYALSDQLTNKGPQKQFSDYSTPSDDVSLKMISGRYKKTFQSYQKKMNDYLCTNAEHFPQFMDDLNNDSFVKRSCNNCCGGKMDKLFDIGFDAI